MKTIARHGYARTTMAHVAKAAGMSQGIVNFYFTSKEALLYETFVHLAEEYEALVTHALEAAGENPVGRLTAMIETDLGPEVCSATKIAVWLAFWSEARSRPKYRDLYRKLMTDYSSQVQDICVSLAERGGYEDVDIAEVTAGFIALIDGFWVNIGVAPDNVDRQKAKTACLAYFAGFFPAEFAELGIAGKQEGTRRVG
jgi:TetR/AcrR family transcriptional repressor of bet genes